ncbi:histidinol dehydrogenase [Kwoniella dendrophila CBS 6074]|uniref:Histidine biosynthesis trifunctional protein n=1 Tax=Kwoniella dendrophila CBS 6074 TaxID=1295534 RepID=A0AAX4JVM4_9TREE
MSTPPFLPLIDPSGSTLLPSLALLGPVLIPADLVQAVLSTLPSQASYYVQAEETNQDLISFLDNGAYKIVITPSQLEQLDGQVPKERLIVKLTEDQLEKSSKQISEQVSGLYIISSSVHTEKSLGLSNIDIYLQHPSPKPLEILESIKSSRPSSYVIPTEFLAASSKTTSTHLSITEAFLSPIITDRPDGLYPTIVSSSNHSIKPLGLVYSSKESITEAILTQKGIYQSRKHGLWRKGESSGSIQDLISIKLDCDSDSLIFEVVQYGTGFCHLPLQKTCFGNFNGLSKLEDTLNSRLQSAPEGSYTKRLFTDENLLKSKIMEEAEELCEANSKDEIAFEAADLFYFALTKCISKGVSLKDVEKALDKKSLKITRRRGDAKPKWEAKINGDTTEPIKPESKPTEPVPKSFPEKDDTARIKMRNVTLSNLNKEEQKKLLLRPVLNSLAMIDKVKPIVERVRKEGDEGLKAMTKQFDKADLKSNVLLPPFTTPSEEELPLDVKKAIDVAYENVKTFHSAQAEKEALVVETMPGVQCSRFVRPISRVGIYVPGGTAILPSTAIMLGVPAQVAGCKTIVLATPPRKDGSISPEVLYVAKLTGVTCILKAGGAQAVGAMAYGTNEVPKVDKIFGPGNQWVTAAKMLVQNDTDALVAIDMPAGPSEVLVIADHTANPIFVASDLLSQAEHGTDSQVVLVGINLSENLLQDIEDQIDIQAKALPRVEIAREAIKKSVIVLVKTQDEAIEFSNEYAPEHLILHLEDAPKAVEKIDNAGSVFVGAFSPESCGDYASGTNHTLPTNGFARQFSGVNTLSFQKHITSQLVSSEGLKVLGPSVVRLAEREGLEAHANAVRVRLAELNK